MDCLHLGKRLKSIRKFLGLSREHIESRYGIPAPTIRYWENSNTNIPVFNLVKYLGIFKSLGIEISLDAILSKDEDFQFLSNMHSPEINSDEHFIHTTLIQDLLQKSSNIFFYANLDSKVLYLNPNYHSYIEKKSSCNLLNNEIFVSDILSKVVNYADPLPQVLLGKSVTFEYLTNDLNVKHLIKLTGNYDSHSKIVGLVAANITT